MTVLHGFVAKGSVEWGLLVLNVTVAGQVLLLHCRLWWQDVRVYFSTLPEICLTGVSSPSKWLISSAIDFLGSIVYLLNRIDPRLGISSRQDLILLTLFSVQRSEMLQVHSVVELYSFVHLELLIET